MTNSIRNRPSYRSGGTPAQRRAAGFTLIEILVAMLVLAIGLLGIAAMQLRGLQYNHDAYLRSQVSVLAYSIADRMRLNKAAAASYAGDYLVDATEPTACTQSAVDADSDLDCWRHEVWEAMPPGSNANIVDRLNGEFRITLTWTDRQSPTPRTVNYTFAP